VPLIVLPRTCLRMRHHPLSPGGEIDAALADANKALELNSNYVDALYLRAALRTKK